MLCYIEIVLIYLKKNNYRFQGKERPPKTKLMPAKLRAVLACAESDFVQCYSLRGVDSAQCKPTLDFRKFF